MELLAGCRTEEAAAELNRLLGRFEIVELEGLADFEDAALVQRICRRGGHTVRSMIDCMVAVMALRTGRPLLARDRDFAVIAQKIELELVDPQSPPEASASRGGRRTTLARPNVAGHRGVTDVPCSISSNPSGHFDTVTIG